MSNYTKTTNFATKDSLASGNPLKVIKGTEIDDEFEAIETSIGTKADTASPTFTGTPAAPTAASGTSSTQLATTAFVQGELDVTVFDTDNLADDSVTTAKIADNAVTSAKIAENAVTTSELNVADSGTAGQALTSDGDGTMTWADVGGGATLRTQLFTAPGTWTKPSNTNRVLVTVIGGGGGSNSMNWGGNGNPGGTSSFGSLVSATGGVRKLNPNAGSGGGEPGIGIVSVGTAIKAGSYFVPERGITGDGNRPAGNDGADCR